MRYTAAIALLSAAAASAFAPNDVSVQLPAISSKISAGRNHQIKKHTAQALGARGGFTVSWLVCVGVGDLALMRTQILASTPDSHIRFHGNPFF